MRSEPRTIVWFREHDLRLADHAPLRAALSAGAVIPFFVLEPRWFSPARARERPHRVQFVLESLAELAQGLAERGSRLMVADGSGEAVLPRLVEQWQADHVVAHRMTEPTARESDLRAAAALGGKLTLFDGETLVPPGTLRTGAGQPYSVFSAFARAWRPAAEVGEELAAPRRLPPLPRGLRALSTALPGLASLGIPKNERVIAGGERAAQGRLRRFVRAALAGYAEQRDRLDIPGTSRLSADLATGTVSIRRVWTAVERAGLPSSGAESFANELIWREFAYSTLWDCPAVLERPFKPAFAGFPWRDDEVEWQAWATGRTGYPVVDAAARQLLAEGFVPNRARMIAASFLTKHLLIDFRRGEAHYLRYLVDGDPANNDLGWQWSAGCGCDAQPYFRVFNPVLQGERFDPQGEYVRRWVPELQRMPPRFVHRPWEAPPGVLGAAGVELGADYPLPIVTHRFVHERFLALARRHLAETQGSAAT